MVSTNLLVFHIFILFLFGKHVDSLSRDVSYVVGSEKVTWLEAFLLCKQADMELASIMNADEEVALENLIRNIPADSGPFGGFWIAGTKFGNTCDSKFVWFTTGKPVIYRKFAPGQPDNYGNNESCLELILNDDEPAWNDANCYSSFKYICQSSNSCL